MKAKAWPLLILPFLLGPSRAPESVKPQALESDASIDSAPLAQKPAIKTVKLPPLPEPAPLPPAPMRKDNEIHALYQAGKFIETLQLIESELAQTPPADYLVWLRKQRGIVYTVLAYQQLENQNCNRALELLDNVPENEAPSAASKARGFCRLMNKDFHEADAYLSTYLRDNPQDSEARQLLVQSKEALGLYDEALDVSSEGAEPQAQARLEAKRDEALQQLQTEAGPYRLSYPPQMSAQFAERIVELMQTTSETLNQSFGVDYPGKTIDVVFYRQERFGELVHGPTWAAAVFDGMIRLPLPEPLIWSSALERIIRHELTHALIAEMVSRRNLPTWFQEGFAQLAECPQLCMDYPFAATTRGFLTQTSLDASFGQLSQREAQLAYKQSLYMMILLVKMRGAANLKNLFSQLASLETMTSATLVEQTGFSIEELHAAAERSWKAGRSL